MCHLIKKKLKKWRAIMFMVVAELATERRAVITTAVLVTVILMEYLALLEAADANPNFGKPATPYPPIKDPPQVIINSPSLPVYINPVFLSITIIQPDSWVTNQSWTLPRDLVDNSNSSNSVVVGQNKLKSITCIIDGQPIILWNGTQIILLRGNGITDYLPKVTQFSAVMNASKGQHNLQVNVLAVSQYATEGIIPFAYKEYIISANQSTTFRVEDGSDNPMIYDIKSSYVIWESSYEASYAMPSPNIAPPQSLNPIPTPSRTPTSAPSQTASLYTPSSSQSPIITSSPSVPELTPFAVLPLLMSLFYVIVLIKHRKNRNQTK